MEFLQKADVGIKDKEARTAYQIAQELDNPDVLAYFNPEERKKQQRIEELLRENTILDLQVKELSRSKEDLQTKMVDIFRRLHLTEQDMIGNDMKLYFLGYSY